ncbi:MAG: hypothetical protein KDK06_17625, partial [Gammaproteobacteria bacterium]|nr:hypothetical protein [Gammaproteobacteria bacterium]
MRPALIGLTLLAASNVAHAEFIWNVMQSNSVGVSNFRYVAPGSGDEFIIDLNGYFNYNGTATFADPVEQPDGHWRSETLDFDITYQDVSGTYYRATPAAGPNGFTLTDPARSQPDQQIISASQIDISLPGNPGNVVATDFVPQHSGLDFILYNTPDLRDPADLPHDPAVDNFLTVLVENLACGVSGCAGPGFAYTSEDWLSDTLASSPDLPSDWTALSLQVKSFDFD